MGTPLTLYGTNQSVLSVDDSPAADTGITTVMGNKTYTLLTTEDGTTGYVDDDDLEETTYSVVEIPRNFAGLEAVMVPTRLRDQFFDITTVDEQDGYIEITALHVWYRLRQDITQWDADNDVWYSGAAACRNIMTWQMSDLGFNVASDCTDILPGGCFDYERKNVATAFLDPESGLCAQYGLSLIRDNFVFYCLKNVGYFRGFIIEDGKNLIGIQRKVNIEDTITRVAPVGKDEDGEYVYFHGIDGHEYVDSEHIHDYPVPRMELYITDVQIGQDGTTEQNIDEKLHDYAMERFTDDKADIPEITLTVQFLSLGDTEEYKQYRDLDKVYLYDIVQIINKERGYNYAAQVISVEYNILTQQLESMTLGTPIKWGTTRKIGTWQLPELSGTKIRQGTIRAGVLAEDSVTSSNLSSGSVSSSSLGESAIGTFETIFAEQLYISNESEDGLLKTRFSVTEGLIEGVVEKTGIEDLEEGETITAKLSVEAGKISQIITAVGDDGEVTAASIVAAINSTTGQSEVHVDADHVYINAGASGERNIVTEIGGKLVASDITTDFLKDRIANIAQLGVQSLGAQSISLSGSLTFSSGDGTTITGAQAADIIRNLKIELVGNTYTLSKVVCGGGQWEEVGSFSRAVSSAVWGWTGGKAKVTLSPQAQSFESPALDEIDQSGNPTWATNKKSFTQACVVKDANGTAVFTDTVAHSFDTTESWNAGYAQGLYDYYHSRNWSTSPYIGDIKIPNVTNTGSETWFTVNFSSEGNRLWGYYDNGWHSYGSSNMTLYSRN